jgi:hypothetical protein
MVNTEKLIEYLKQTPFPEAEQQRLIRLVEVADDDGKRKIYTFAEDFVQKLNTAKAAEEKNIENIKAKGKEIRTFLRQKGEEIYTEAESSILQNLETQLSTIS